MVTKMSDKIGLKWRKCQNSPLMHVALNICIHIDEIKFGIVTNHFSLICDRVMALDQHQNFVSAQ